MGKQVGMSVDIADGKVIIEFQEPMKWVEMTPQQAAELAKAIAEKVVKITGRHNSSIIIPRHEILNS